MTKPFCILTLALVIGSCAPKTTTQQSKYFEDLSAYRPSYSPQAKKPVYQDVANTNNTNPIQPTHDITDKLEVVLDSISVLSQNIEYVNGFTVQIYSGTSRQGANMANGKAQEILENNSSQWKSKMSYNAPNFKVQVGQFYTNIDAHTVHAQLLNDFPHSIVVMKKFKLNTEQVD